ncbi:hypothetical protein C8R48DRAFT_299137 [Suillus tomentosus]|nr:hypothetical protein C8R48DRAFT_299137 [Suillus tomentosus]
MIKFFSQYSPIDTVDDDDKLAKRFGTESCPKSRIRRLWLSHGVLICTSILSFALWMRTPSTQLRNDIPSIYSPASVAVEPVTLRINGTLDFPSIYRGPPSPEMDATWDRISRNVGPTRMTREEMLKAGTTLTELRSKVRYPDEVGGGYMASMEAIHQLHCVNLLRKASWFEHYSASTDRSFQFPPDVIHVHIGEYYFCLKAILLTVYRYGPGHCIEMLRQSIMCKADTTMITWYWVQGHDAPQANFNTRHRCRNFEKILDWSFEHAVHIDESKLIRFEDTIDLPKPPRDA